MKQELASCNVAKNALNSETDALYYLERVKKGPIFGVLKKICHCWILGRDSRDNNSFLAVVYTIIVRWNICCSEIYMAVRVRFVPFETSRNQSQSYSFAAIIAATIRE